MLAVRIQCRRRLSRSSQDDRLLARQSEICGHSVCNEIRPAKSGKNVNSLHRQCFPCQKPRAKPPANHAVALKGGHLAFRRVSLQPRETGEIHPYAKKTTANVPHAEQSRSSEMVSSRNPQTQLSTSPPRCDDPSHLIRFATRCGPAALR